MCIGIKAAALPHFQLAAPQAAVVHIGASVIIYENGRVDAVAAGHIVIFRSEGTGGVIGNRNADAEDTVLVACREVEVILSVLVRGIGSPHLLADPGDILHVQGTTVVHTGRIHTVHGQDVVVFHAVLIAIVIVLAVVGNVMGGVYVDFAIEDVGGRIRGKDMGDQRLALFTHEEALLFELLRLLYNKAPGKESGTDKFIQKRHGLYQLKIKGRHEIMSRFFRQNGVPLC